MKRSRRSLSRSIGLASFAPVCDESVEEPLPLIVQPVMGILDIEAKTLDRPSGVVLAEGRTIEADADEANAGRVVFNAAQIALHVEDDIARRVGLHVRHCRLPATR